MRQRKVKNEEERLKAHHQYLIGASGSMKGRWQEVFKNKDSGIYAELGCGKGKFVMTLAAQNPDRNYIAVEGRGSVILRALEKAAREGLDNIVFVHEYVRDVNEYFNEEELAGIYLNFSDPWPKDRHAKRRLIHRRYLEGYRRVLKKGGCLEFKTDNKDLFSFALGEFFSSGMILLESTEDLHSTDLPAKHVTTEYEDKFRADGIKINFCRMQVPEQEK